MKAILDGKLYDTEKAENLCNFYNHSVYRTDKDALFMTYSDKNTEEQISSINQGDIKKAIGQYCPDAYIVIFGEVEEA